jgi:hypothetical protein
LGREKTHQRPEGVFDDESFQPLRILTRKVHSDGATDGLAIEEDWRLLEIRVGEDVVESCLRIELEAVLRWRPVAVSVAAAKQPTKEVGERGERGKGRSARKPWK